MNELYYNAFDLACIIHSLNLGTRTASILIESMWKNDKQYLAPIYRTNLRQLYREVYYWSDYLCDKPAIDKEFPAIQKDFISCGKNLEEATFVTDYFDIDLFFKMKRIQILYLEGQNYVKMKLKTLLKAYGYKHRTQKLLDYLRICMSFYHMRTYLPGNKVCDIGGIGLDEMIIIRII